MFSDESKWVRATAFQSSGKFLFELSKYSKKMEKEIDLILDLILSIFEKGDKDISENIE